MRPKSLKSLKQEFRKQGIFYTPPELAKKLKSYVDIEPESVYDPTCGAGNLLKVFPENVKKYGQELDAEQLEMIDIPNFTGYAGDTLMDDGFSGMQFGCIVANPPFSVKWNPDELAGDVRFRDCPAVPPPSKADWAFMLHILRHLSDDGVAVVLESPGILTREQREGKVRKWFVGQNYIERIVNIPKNTFEDTDVSTCIIVLRKNKQTTDIIFEDGDKTVTVKRETIAGKGYTLNPSCYIPKDVEKDERDLNEVSESLIADTVGQVKATRNLLAMFDTIVNAEYAKKLDMQLGGILDDRRGENG